MMYISKGNAMPTSGDNELTVNLRGREHSLSEGEATLWLSGQHTPKTLSFMPHSLQNLLELGLVETSEESDALGHYRLLTGCVMVPAKPKLLRKPLSPEERTVWKWLGKAGLRLTIAELVCLAKNGIVPVPEYLGESNLQKLVEAIYTTQTIFDGILENLMEQSTHRDGIVDAVLGLLRKRRIILI